MVEQFKINKTTMIFKINIVDLLDKYPKLMKSSMTLNFLKTDFKDIKEIYAKNSSELR